MHKANCPRLLVRGLSTEHIIGKLDSGKQLAKLAKPVSRTQGGGKEEDWIRIGLAYVEASQESSLSTYLNSLCSRIVIDGRRASGWKHRRSEASRCSSAMRSRWRSTCQAG